MRSTRYFKINCRSRQRSYHIIVHETLVRERGERIKTLKENSELETITEDFGEYIELLESQGKQPKNMITNVKKYIITKISMKKQMKVKKKK